MKTIILFLSLFFSCFALASLQADHLKTSIVEFYDLSVEDLPPLEEMVGIVPDLERKDFERGEEIQLAHGEGNDSECRRRHGHRDCGYGHDHGHGHNHSHGNNHDTIIIAIPVPAPQSYICRSGGFFCHLSYTSSIGSYCECYSFGYLLFRGNISTW